MKLRPTVLILLLLCLYLKEAISFCPAETELEPYCHCDDLDFICNAKHEMQPWDIVGFFDKVSTLIPEDTVYDSFNLEATTLKEIPAGAFKKIKFRNITLYLNDELEYIHPNVFGSTLETLTILHIEGNHGLTNEGLSDPTYNLFNFLNQLRNLEDLHIYDNPIQSLPDNAFGTLPSLTNLLFDLAATNITLKKLGSRLFSGLPKLQTLQLHFSDILLENIAKDAFEGIGKDAHVFLKDFKLTTLPEKIFKPLLDNARRVSIQYPENGNDGIACNEEFDWICKDMAEYQNRIEGFVCLKGSEFNDIFEYCEKVASKN